MVMVILIMIVGTGIRVTEEVMTAHGHKIDDDDNNVGCRDFFKKML